MIPAQSQEARTFGNQTEGCIFDFIRHVSRATEIEVRITRIDNGQSIKRIKLHAVRPLPCHDS